MSDFKTTVYWQIYINIFNFHKKYANPTEQDEFWSSLITESNNIHKKYKELPEGEFVKRLLLTIAAEIERSYRNGNG